MCGIAGKLHWGVDENNSSVSLMLDKMVHRGPNDFGLTHLPKITLGHRRLSIIDLSSDAKQPMQVEKRYYITFREPRRGRFVFGGVIISVKNNKGR